MADRVSIPVQLLISNLLDIVKNLLNTLGNLKVGTKGYRELEGTINRIQNNIEKLLLQGSKPFVSERQFTAADKTISQLEENMRHVASTMQHIKFGDLELDNGLKEQLKSFENEIENLKKSIASLKNSTKESFLSGDFGALYKDIDPAAATRSFDEIGKRINKYVNEQVQSVNKAKEALKDYLNAQQVNTNIDLFLSGKNGLDAKTMGKNLYDQIFLNISRMNGTEITRFTNKGRSLLEDYLILLYDLDPSYVHELVSKKASEVLSIMTATNSEVTEKLKAAQEKTQEKIRKTGVTLSTVDAANQKLTASIKMSEAYHKSEEEIEKSAGKINEKMSNVHTNMIKWLDALVGALRTTPLLASDTSRFSQELENLRSSLASSSSEFLRLQLTASNFNAIKMSIANFMGFRLVLNVVKSSITEAANHIKELDSVMNKISIVTDMSTGDLWGQVAAYSDMAQKYGTSIKGAYEVSQIYYQQGLSTNEVLTLTDLTLKLAAISGLDYATTTDYMTTALRGFKIEAEDAARVVDVYSNLAAHTAVSLEELAVAMTKTASSMEAVGATFEETSAMIGTMVAVTRESATNIGSAMKSIASRYGELTKDPLTLVDEDGETLAFNKVDAALLSVGISMHTVDGQFRSFTEVITELGEKWEQLDSTQLRYIATLFAGNRLQSRFLALISNIDTFKANLEYAEDSENTGTLQALKALDSIEAKTELVRVAYQLMYTSIGAEEIWKGVLDLTKDFINTLNGLSKPGAFVTIVDTIKTLKNVGLGTLSKVSDSYFNGNGFLGTLTGGKYRLKILEQDKLRKALKKGRTTQEDVKSNTDVANTVSAKLAAEEGAAAAAEREAAANKETAEAAKLVAEIKKETASAQTPEKTEATNVDLIIAKWLRLKEIQESIKAGTGDINTLLNERKGLVAELHTSTNILPTTIQSRIDQLLGQTPAEVPINVVPSVDIEALKAKISELGSSNGIGEVEVKARVSLVDELNSLDPSILGKMLEAVDSIDFSNLENVKAQISTLASSMKESFSAAGQDIGGISQDIIASIIIALAASRGLVLSASKELGGAVLEGLRSGINAHSPSPTIIAMFETGVGQAIELGLTLSAKAVTNAAEQLGLTVTDSLKKSLDKGKTVNLSKYFDKDTALLLFMKSAKEETAYYSSVGNLRNGVHSNYAPPENFLFDQQKYQLAFDIWLKTSQLYLQSSSKTGQMVATHGFSPKNLSALLDWGAIPNVSYAIRSITGNNNPRNHMFNSSGHGIFFLDLKYADPKSGLGDIFSGDGHTPVLNKPQSLEEAHLLILSLPASAWEYNQWDLTDYLSNIRRMPDLSTVSLLANKYGLANLRHSMGAYYGTFDGEKELKKELSLLLLPLVDSMHTDLKNSGIGSEDRDAVTAYALGDYMTALQEKEAAGNPLTSFDDKVALFQEKIAALNTELLTLIKFSEDTITQAINFIDGFLKLASFNNKFDYLEGKATQDVPFSDILSAVLPQNLAPDLLQKLSMAGLSLDKIHLYDPLSSQSYEDAMKAATALSTFTKDLNAQLFIDSKQFESAGDTAGESAKIGILGSISKVFSAAVLLGLKMLEGLKSGMNAHSPSPTIIGDVETGFGEAVLIALEASSEKIILLAHELGIEITESFKQGLESGKTSINLNELVEKGQVTKELRLEIMIKGAAEKIGLGDKFLSIKDLLTYRQLIDDAKAHGNIEDQKEALALFNKERNKYNSSYLAKNEKAILHNSGLENLKLHEATIMSAILERIIGQLNQQLDNEKPSEVPMESSNKVTGADVEPIKALGQEAGVAALALKDVANAGKGQAKASEGAAKSDEEKVEAAEDAAAGDQKKKDSAEGVANANNGEMDASNAAADADRQEAAASTAAASKGYGRGTVFGISTTTLSSIGSGLSMLAGTLPSILSKFGADARTSEVLGGVTNVASGALKGVAGFFSGNPMAMISGVLSIINGFDLMIENDAEKLERLTKESEEAKNESLKATGEYKELQSAEKKLADLLKKRYDSEEDAEAYNEYVNNLTSLFPALIDSFDEAGNAIINETELTNMLTRARKESAHAALEAAEAEVKRAKLNLKIALGQAQDAIGKITGRYSAEATGVNSNILGSYADAMFRYSGDANASSLYNLGEQSIEELLKTIHSGLAAMMQSNASMDMWADMEGMSDPFIEMYKKYRDANSNDDYFTWYQANKDNLTDANLLPAKAITDYALGGTLVSPSGVDYKEFNSQLNALKEVQSSDDAKKMVELTQKFQQYILNTLSTLTEDSEEYDIFSDILDTLSSEDSIFEKLSDYQDAIDSVVFSEKDLVSKKLSDTFGTSDIITKSTGLFEPIFSSVYKAFTERQDKNQNFADWWTSAGRKMSEGLITLGENILTLMTDELESTFKSMIKDKRYYTAEGVKNYLSSLGITLDESNEASKAFFDGIDELFSGLADIISQLTEKYAGLDKDRYFGIDSMLSALGSNPISEAARQMTVSLIDTYKEITDYSGDWLGNDYLLAATDFINSIMGYKDAELKTILLVIEQTGYTAEGLHEAADKLLENKDDNITDELALLLAEEINTLADSMFINIGLTFDALADAFIESWSDVSKNIQSGISGMDATSANKWLNENRKYLKKGGLKDADLTLSELLYEDGLFFATMELLRAYERGFVEDYTEKTKLANDRLEDIINASTDTPWLLEDWSGDEENRKFQLDRLSQFAHEVGLDDLFTRTVDESGNVIGVLLNKDLSGHEVTPQEAYEKISKKAGELLAKGKASNAYITQFYQQQIDTLQDAIDVTGYLDSEIRGKLGGKSSKARKALENQINMYLTAQDVAGLLFEDVDLDQLFRLIANHFEKGGYDAQERYREYLAAEENNNTKFIEDYTAYLIDLMELGGTAAVDALKILNPDASAEAISKAYSYLFDEFTSALLSLSDISKGSIATGKIREAFERVQRLLIASGLEVTLIDSDGVIQDTSHMVEVYKEIYEKMQNTAGATTAGLNNAYAQVMTAEDLANIDIVDALKNGNGMSYLAFGELLANYDIKLEEYMHNLANAVMRDGFGNIRITDWNAFAKSIWGDNLDLVKNTLEYTSAFKAYNDGLIELNKNTELAIVDEVKLLENAKGGDWINLTEFGNLYYNALAKSTDWHDYFEKNLYQGLALALAEEAEKSNAKIFDNLNSLLRQWDASFEDGILKIGDNANLLGIALTLEQASADAGLEIGNGLEEVKDTVLNILHSIREAISKGISGELDHTGKLDLISKALSLGINNLDFTETKNGFKLTNESARELYNTLSDINDFEGELLFEDLRDSLIASEDHFKTIQDTTKYIISLQTELNALRSLEMSPDNKKRIAALEKELALAEKINMTRSIDTEDDSFKFMEGDIPAALNNPLNYWDNLAKAFDVMKEAGKATGKAKNTMGYQDFYNIVTEMGRLAELSEQPVLFGGRFLENALDAADLITAGAGALKNVDGKMKVDLSKIGIELDTKGLQNTAKSLEEGVDAVADSLIAMLDSLISLLETIVAMEELEDIDADHDLEIELPEIAVEQDNGQWKDADGYIIQFNELYKLVLQHIKDSVALDDEGNSVFDKVSINTKTGAHTISDILSADEKKLKEWQITAQDYTLLMSNLLKMSKSNDYKDMDGTVLSIIDVFLGYDWGDMSLSVNTGNNSITLNDAGLYLFNWDKVNYDNIAEEFSNDYPKYKTKRDEEIKNQLLQILDKYNAGKDLNITESTKLKLSQNKIQIKKDKEGKKTYIVNGHSYDSSEKASIASDMFDAGLLAEDFDFTQDTNGKTVGAKGKLKINNYEIEVESDGSGKPKFKASDGQTYSSRLAALDASFKHDNNLGKDVSVDHESIEYLTWEVTLGIRVSPVYKIEGHNKSGDINKNKELRDAVREYLDSDNKNFEYTDGNKALKVTLPHGLEIVIPTNGKQFNNDKEIEDYINETLGDDLSIDLHLKDTIASAIKEAFDALKTSLTSEDLESISTIASAFETINSSLNTLAANEGLKKFGELVEALETDKFTEVSSMLSTIATSLGQLAANGSWEELNQYITLLVDNLEKLRDTSPVDIKLNFEENGILLKLEKISGLLDKIAGTNITSGVNGSENPPNGLKPLNTQTPPLELPEAVTETTGTIKLTPELTEDHIVVDGTAMLTSEVTDAPIETGGVVHLTPDVDEVPRQEGNAHYSVDVDKVPDLQATAYYSAVTTGLPGDLHLTAYYTTKILDGPGRATGNVGLAKGTLGEAKASGTPTLMGELGPELVVQDGHYFVAGQSGAEMVDLGRDAIVFNHLQTELLLKNGMSSGRGRAVTNERNAVAFATGNVNGGPAMASASAALAALKQLRAMWQSLKSASVSDLAGAGGGGGGGGGGGDNAKIIDPRAWVDTVERWFDLMQKIAKCEREITHEETLRQKLLSDWLKNGKQYFASQTTSLESLREQINLQEELNVSRRDYFNKRIEALENEPLGKLYKFNAKTGEMQFKGTQINGKDGVMEFLTDLVGFDNNKGANYTNKEKYDILMKAGFANYMKFDSNGMPIKKDSDNDGETTDEELESYYENATKAFWEHVDEFKESTESLFESIAEGENKLLELQASMNEIWEEMRDNQMEVENEVLEAIEDMKLREIDALQDERDKLEESVSKYIDGLTDALNKELEMYEDQEAESELNRKRRQLGILLRSGASAADISSLQSEIDSSARDMYFDALQRLIDAIQEASDKQLERMDTLILLMTELLEYLKMYGLLWNDVYSVMDTSARLITDFIVNGNSKFWAESPLSTLDKVNELIFKTEQWDEYKKSIDPITKLAVMTQKQMDAEAYNTFNQAMTNKYGANYDKGNKYTQAGGYKEKFDKVWKETGDVTKATETARAAYAKDKKYLDQEAAANSAGKAWMKDTAGDEYKSINDAQHWHYYYAEQTIAGVKGYYFLKAVREDHNWSGDKCSNCGHAKPKPKESPNPGWIPPKGCGSNCSGYCKDELTGGSGSSSSSKKRNMGKSIGVKFGDPTKGARGGYVDHGIYELGEKGPETVLTASQTLVLRNNILSNRPNSLISLLKTYNSGFNQNKLASYSSDILKRNEASESVNIENATVNMNVSQIANDYDARRAGEQAMNEIMRIARKTSAANSIRR